MGREGEGERERGRMKERKRLDRLASIDHRKIRISKMYFAASADAKEKGKKVFLFSEFKSFFSQCHSFFLSHSLHVDRLFTDIKHR